jgi:hypothetical protein
VNMAVPSGWSFFLLLGDFYGIFYAPRAEILDDLP